MQEDKPSAAALIKQEDQLTSRSTTPNTRIATIDDYGFDKSAIRAYIRTLFDSTLKHVEYDSQTSREHGREICRRIKNRVAERIPKKWKASVLVTIAQNLGQGGRADLSTHWTSEDVCFQEVWTSEHLQCAAFVTVVKYDAPDPHE